MKDFRQIAVSPTGSKIALGAFEKHVKIVDLLTKETQAEFETILDFGGRRLAIHEDGEICVCGCWERHGIIGYSTRDGAILWQRKDLKKLQGFRSLRSAPDKLFAEFGKGTSCILNFKNGKTFKDLPRIKDYAESAFEPIDLLEGGKHFSIVERDSQKTQCRIERQSFGTLNIAFGPGSVCVSESGWQLYCYDTKTGQQKWHISSEVREHALRLSYNRIMNRYLAVFWPYEHGGDHTLRIINPDTGSIENSIPFKNMIESAFALDGEVLVGIHFVAKECVCRLHHIRTGKTEELA